MARNTIKAILKDHGIAPAPERGTPTPWKAFLAAHWDSLAAADSFTFEVLTLGGLVRYCVFFVMKLKTRAMEIACITCHPSDMWMTQLVRNLLDAGDGFLRGVQYVVLERDPLSTHRVSAPAAGQRREATPAARAESEFEGLRFILHLIRLIQKEVQYEA